MAGDCKVQRSAATGVTLHLEGIYLSTVGIIVAFMALTHPSSVLTTPFPLLFVKQSIECVKVKIAFENNQKQITNVAEVCFIGLFLEGIK